ncbi:hypothetical protein NA57DRAFT_82370 [Rhizodiscina lignyota]|uniref:Uncharacterized protein n=1 Tax=Rhizodiscina lignyota TaxID=1504668 RepID=A0A9P4I2Q3_9PEZI|nr:hypothetical protein NA57DRAFT_82370 [Rhizodiscina lignyota]
MGISSRNSLTILDSIGFGSNVDSSLDAVMTEEGNIYGIAAGTDIPFVDPSFGPDTLSLSNMDMSTVPLMSHFDAPVVQPGASELSGIGQVSPKILTQPITGGMASECTAEVSTSNTESPREQSIDLQLSELFRMLVLHKNTHPPLSIHSSGQSFNFPANATGDNSSNPTCRAHGLDGSNRPNMPSISEVFHFTQRLTDLYSDLASMVGAPIPACQVLPGDPRRKSQDAATKSSVSQATILVALSCHHQIVSIWEQTFAHTNEMVRCGIFNSSEYHGSACLPLKIGSFVTASKSSVWSAVVSLIADLIYSLEQSFGRLTDSIRENSTDHNAHLNTDSPDGNPTAPPSATGIDATFLETLVPVCEVAHSRSAGLMDKLNLIREVLTDNGLLK